MPHHAPRAKDFGGCGAGTRTLAASNRASMSMAHITRAVPNILVNTNLPFTQFVLLDGSVEFRCTDHHARLRLLDYTDR